MALPGIQNPGEASNCTVYPWWACRGPVISLACLISKYRNQQPLWSHNDDDDDDYDDDDDDDDDEDDDDDNDIDNRKN